MLGYSGEVWNPEEPIALQHPTPNTHTHITINDRGDLKVLVIYQSSVMERMWFELCME